MEYKLFSSIKYVSFKCLIVFGTYILPFDIYKCISSGKQPNIAVLNYKLLSVNIVLFLRVV